MIILVLFLLIPLLLGVLTEYLVCRFTRRWGWKLLPPVAALLLTALFAWGRIRVWASPETSPLTQLIFVPGLPAAAFLVGLLLGWRIWRWYWSPRVI